MVVAVVYLYSYWDEKEGPSFSKSLVPSCLIVIPIRFKATPLFSWLVLTSYHELAAPVKGVGIIPAKSYTEGRHSYL